MFYFVYTMQRHMRMGDFRKRNPFVKNKCIIGVSPALKNIA